MAKVYAGIGSRRTPTGVLAQMQHIAAALAANGWTMRSGHAPGADQAFEAGAQTAAEIFLPWASFESAHPPVAAVVRTAPKEAAYEIAAQYHPGWRHLKRGARALMARNVHQILGWDLASPVKMVICWTPDGSLDGKGKDTGGTGQALRIATDHEIEVFNLAHEAHAARLTQWLSIPP